MDRGICLGSSSLHFRSAMELIHLHLTTTDTVPRLVLDQTHRQTQPREKFNDRRWRVAELISRRCPQLNKLFSQTSPLVDDFATKIVWHNQSITTKSEDEARPCRAGLGTQQLGGSNLEIELPKATDKPRHRLIWG